MEGESCDVRNMMIVNFEVWDFACASCWHVGNVHYSSTVKIPVVIFAVLAVHFGVTHACKLSFFINFMHNSYLSIPCYFRYCDIVMTSLLGSWSLAVDWSTTFVNCG